MKRILPVVALLVSGSWFAPPASAQDTPYQSLVVPSDGTGSFVRLGAEAELIDVIDAMNTDGWDVAFVGTDVMVNGGEAGPAGVVAHCICQNAMASGDELQVMTPESELADFESVTIADIPEAADDWHPAAIAAAPWYRYNLAQQHMIWPTYNVYLIKNGERVYKLQVTGYYGADGTPRQLSFRYQMLK